jgi:hypothetical protein
MNIKSDKTFEEIVERLVALFKGQHEPGVSEARTRPSDADLADDTPMPSAPAAASDPPQPDSD